MSNLTSASGEASVSSGNRAENGSIYPQNYFPPPPPPPNQTQPVKKRKQPGNPDPNAEVIALSPGALMATNKFLCEICNKGFQRDQNLQLHRRGHNLPWKLKQRTNKEVRKKVYVCPEASCVHHDPSRALGDLTGIKKHFCRKHGEKKWKCEKCSKRYAVKSDWKAHSKTCGTKEYRCDCGTPFSRRDSFITHRAFCDALVEESSRLITVNPVLLSSQPNAQFNAHHFHPFPMKQEHQNSSVPQWLACPQEAVGTGPGPPPFPLTSPIFSTSLDQDLTLYESPNPKPSVGPTLPPPYHPSAAYPNPQMSATALLQKAAETGAGKSCSLLRPHQAHVSTNTGNGTTGFGLNLSSREEMGSGFVHGLASFGNKAADPYAVADHLPPSTAGAPLFLQDIMTSLSSATGFDESTFEDTFSGILDSKKDSNFHESVSMTTTHHISRTDEGGGTGNDGMTRDFLGLRPLFHTDILTLAGLGSCMNTSQDQQNIQFQTQKSWQG